MDPDQLLLKLREYASEVMLARDDVLREDPDGECWSNELHLAMSFLDLDEWLTKGGFLPNDWQGKPGALGHMRAAILLGAGTVAVADLHVNCSYLDKPEMKKRGGFALSDTCQQPADTVVVTVADSPDGVSYLYRCPQHRGLIHDNEPGDVMHRIIPSRN